MQLSTKSIRCFQLTTLYVNYTFTNTISFSVLTLPVNVNIFDRKFGGISFLTCESTETGAVTQRVNKS